LYSDESENEFSDFENVSVCSDEKQFYVGKGNTNGQNL